MAGAGFKSFAAGEVLLASEVNTFLMEQTVMVFDDAAARDAVITAPSEGMLCYLKDTNAVEKYTGSDWVAVVEDTSPITTEGDLIVGDATGVPVRLPVGAAGEVLTSDGDTVLFIAPSAAGANFSLLNAGGTALTGATTITVSGISAADKLFILIQGASAGAGSLFSVRFNADSANNYRQYGLVADANAAYSAGLFTTSAIFGSPPRAAIFVGSLSTNGNSVMNGYLEISGCSSAGTKVFTASSGATAAGGNSHRALTAGGIWDNSASVTSVSIISDTGNFDAGTIFVYTSA